MQGEPSRERDICISTTERLGVISNSAGNTWAAERARLGCALVPALESVVAYLSK